MKNTVFLGGTCGNNNWRESFIEDLVDRGVPAECLFNPVVSDWNAEAQAREDFVKSTATYNLYYLGDPMQPENHLFTYSMVEATLGLAQDKENYTNRTVVVFDYTGYKDDLKQFEKVMKKVHADFHRLFPNAHVFGSLEDAKDFFEIMLEPAKFAPGNLAKAKQNFKFIDGSYHTRGSTYMVDSMNCNYYNLRSKDYDKVE